MVEYLCENGHRSESLEERAHPRESITCPCGDVAERTVSAVLGRMPIATVTRGKPETPPWPHAYSTRELGDGMPYSEWKAKRDKVFNDRRIKKLKEML